MHSECDETCINIDGFASGTAQNMYSFTQRKTCVKGMAHEREDAHR